MGMKYLKLFENRFDNFKFEYEYIDDSFSILSFYNNDLVGKISFSLISEAYEYEFSDMMNKEEYNNFFKTENPAHLESLYVDEYYQNMGLGKHLVNLCLLELEKHVDEVYLNAYPNRKGLSLNKLVSFYKSIGFKTVLNQGKNVLMMKKINVI